MRIRIEIGTFQNPHNPIRSHVRDPIRRFRIALRLYSIRIKNLHYFWFRFRSPFGRKFTIYFRPPKQFKKSENFCVFENIINDVILVCGTLNNQIMRVSREIFIFFCFADRILPTPYSANEDNSRDAPLRYEQKARVVRIGSRFRSFHPIIFHSEVPFPPSFPSNSSPPFSPSLLS